jgi:hypothetical protein
VFIEKIPCWALRTSAHLTFCLGNLPPQGVTQRFVALLFSFLCERPAASPISTIERDNFMCALDLCMPLQSRLSAR